MSRKLIFLISLVLVFGAAVGTANAADPILAGWWQFDGNGLDSSGNGRDGVIFGDPKWVDGKVGGAMDVDGDDWVEVPGTSAADGFPAMDGEVTWAVWFKTSDAGVINTVLAQGPAGAAHVQGNRSINIEASGVIMIRAHSVGALTSINSSAVVNDGEWHHVAVTIAFETDGANDTMKVYIDGDLGGGYESDTVDINQHGGVASDFILTIGARGTTPFNGQIDDVRVYDHVLSEVEILAAMAAKPWPFAFGPGPADGALHEDTWVNLSWKPGELAASHNVYIGESFEDVDAGAEGTFQGNQTATNLVIGFPGFPYPDGLVPGTTYYWRIDEVNEAEPNSPWKGDVWSFSIPPRTAYNPDPADGAEFVDVDSTLSWTPGYGAKLHTVYLGDNYDDVNNASGGSPQGSATYKPASLEAEKVYYWRVDEFDAIATYKGDIWGFTTPGAAGSLQPANGVVDVQMNSQLIWIPATNAVSHDLYFGTDREAVRNATIVSPQFKGNKALGSESYNPGKLAWDSDYYWRVDAVYNTGTVKGLVWKFSTADFLLVDDFESYNDVDPPDPNSNRIFDMWIDGFGTTDNGALVGNDLPPYAEQTVVHGGAQSMPYTYDNNLKTSEATLTLVRPRDWTEEGVMKLSLWFRGASANSAGRMYVALNGSAVVYNDDTAATQKGGWNQWVIDLTEFTGVNLTNVNTITIGIGTKGSPAAGGTGTMYFDDIRLYQ